MWSITCQLSACAQELLSINYVDQVIAMLYPIVVGDSVYLMPSVMQFKAGCPVWLDLSRASRFNQGNPIPKPWFLEGVYTIFEGRD